MSLDMYDQLGAIPPLPFLRGEGRGEGVFLIDGSWGRQNISRPSAAFSLVEVMCAIFILGIALVGLVQGITTALGSSKESELQTTAVLLASGKIEKLRAEGFIEDGVNDGDCGEDLPNYQWKQTITSTSIKGLHQIELVVESAPSGKQICELRTMLFEPYVPAEAQQKNDKKRGQSGGKRKPEQ